MLDTAIAKRADEDHWVPLSDLMTGLMMIFMLLAIVFMLKVNRDAKSAADQAKIIEKQAQQIKDIALNYSDIRFRIYSDLMAEFQNDLPVWRAKLSSDLTLRFEEPSVQFDTGQAVIKPGFSKILESFFPRYVRILRSERYRDEVEEIRVEGHTSSIWTGLTPEKAYYENMRLSQDRTRAVLQHVLSLPATYDSLSWLIQRITANGLSSARRIFTADGREDQFASQRVEFRVRTKAEDRLSAVLNALPTR